MQVSLVENTTIPNIRKMYFSQREKKKKLFTTKIYKWANCGQKPKPEPKFTQPQQYFRLHYFDGATKKNTP